MTGQVLHQGKLSKTKLLFISIGAMLLVLACTLLFADKANAHGWMDDSRSDLCYRGINVDCGRVMYEPWSIEGRGDFPEVGVPDGQIASGSVFRELDEQSYDRWVKVDMQGGPFTFHWRMVANHSTNTWDYYITKPGWDPNAPISRNDLELFCRYEDHGALPPMDVYNDCFIPNDREGYHLIIGVWDIFDTVNAFYQVMDVNLSRNPAYPAQPEPGFPGDPNRFGAIRDWVDIRPYNTGEQVVHNGSVWEARWWTRGQEPGTNEVWVRVGPAPDDNNNPGQNPGNPGQNPGDPGQNPGEEPEEPEQPQQPNYPTWNAQTVYINEIVYHNGQLWQARWWNQNQMPGTTGEWGPWVLVN